MSEQSHHPTDLIALIREADGIMLASDAELLAGAKRDGWEHCRKRVQAIAEASARLGVSSSGQEDVDLKLADAWLSARCADAAERLLKAAMTPLPRERTPSFLDRVLILFRRRPS